MPVKSMKMKEETAFWNTLLDEVQKGWEDEEEDARN
jgi:hypothetical protein